MPVIAMTREMGSRGKDVAYALAEEFKLRIVQHELVEHVAQRMHVDESSVNHFLEGTASFLERWGIDSNDLSLRTAEEILDLAEEGNVLFRGWGATHVLNKVDHAVCVRVCAPLSQRAETLMSRVGITDREVAMAEIRKNDAAHARVLSRLFHADPTDPLGYDAVLNRGRLSVESCVSVIRTLVEAPEHAVTDHSMSALRHRRTESRIRAALRENDMTKRAGPSFEVILDPDTGMATLRGVVFDQEFRRAAVDLVERVDGVSGVVDEMWVPQPTQFGP